MRRVKLSGFLMRSRTNHLTGIERKSYYRAAAAGTNIDSKEVRQSNMQYEGFTLQKEEGIAILTLNRPEKLNALTKRMFETDLPDVFAKVRQDDDIKVFIITGTGRGFCSGADVSELATGAVVGRGGARWLLVEPFGGSLVNGLRKIEKPVLAAINGVAAGAGLSLAMLCDIRIASETARFSLAFVLRGLIPDCGATYTVSRQVGTSRALELMFTGDIIDAKEADRIGLVNRVVPQDKLMPVTKELAMKIAKQAPIAVAMIKQAAHKGVDNSLEQQLDFESFAQELCLGTEDHKEAVKAFLEKREAVFKGK